MVEIFTRCNASIFVICVTVAVCFSMVSLGIAVSAVLDYFRDKRNYLGCACENEGCCPLKKVEVAK